MKRRAFIALFFITFVFFLPPVCSIAWGVGLDILKKKPGEVVFLYGDREVADEAKGMKRAWGFAPLVRFDGKTILFNAGGDSAIMKHNMEVAKVDPSEIDILVISHEHWYLYQGASSLLKLNPKIQVYATPTVKDMLIQEDEKWGKNIHLVDRTVKITPNIFVHEMKSMPRHGGRFGILTLNMFLKTTDGLIVIGACGHVNVFDMLKQDSRIAHESIVHMYIGGMHLLPPGKEVDLPGGRGKYIVPQEFSYSDEYILKLINKLHELGVEKIMPTNCTGERAEALFKKDFKENYIKQFLGMTLKIAPPIR